MSVSRFWRKIPQRYNLVGTQCTTCGRYFFPPRSLCPDCRRSGNIVDHQFTGEGTVVTYTVIRSASDQFDHTTPYVLAIVKLDEGPRLTTQVACLPEEAKIGMRVKSVFRRVTADGESGTIHYGTKFVPVE
ncbi:MAG: Zn-ribbon domain-containing OB-fold protein [Methanoculleus sp.]|uniref:Zn-ribbon domain-containing OB-fold protein n=1 Tax=unclassified Methanoculleus TaxID=2619537 RepID=UPI0025DF8600|nr:MULTISPECIES: Zn-ribbon domain-containing OB-fold protein [unclassified Methanoculleus]MCK9319063.1 Zn-ribbon domain-containing OB-fold protein [Methanoculleus sp.]MDD2252820.1 Zn-ribbon domain-containing OB-fold protein [Methanoculleus sp.]MDD3215197.1 Zn-ribbon domain-containing OB-fold protein [Methanoculleus sp.]MDD4313063.1 Zn-ribbon domain-containing OB-fold protein [Methanoculleus sp.]MDD4471724.1 Zn-ribbon domain-containing OB-fold protein [Methanoculleus sp.]